MRVYVYGKHTAHRPHWSEGFFSLSQKSDRFEKERSSLWLLLEKRELPSQAGKWFYCYVYTYIHGKRIKKESWACPSKRLFWKWQLLVEKLRISRILFLQAAHVYIFYTRNISSLFPFLGQSLISFFELAAPLFLFSCLVSLFSYPFKIIYPCKEMREEQSWDLFLSLSSLLPCSS